jgi:predicted glycogen debranching enzyme
VPTLQKTGGSEIISVPMCARPIEDSLTKEWLLTNERGGYASSTIVGCNTRRYHGLLIGSLKPLANRIIGLANCLEMVILDEGAASCNESQSGKPGTVFNLATFEFGGKIAPEGFRYLTRFCRDTGVHFDYRLGTVGLTKSVYLLRDADTVALVYDFANVEETVSQRDCKMEFVLRPFVGLRDFHTLQKSYAPLCSVLLDNGLSIRHDVAGSCELFLSCSSMSFRKDQQWWFNFLYRGDRERGQDYTEDLWSPGFFKCRLYSGGRIVFWASLGGGCKARRLPNVDIEGVLEELERHQENIRCKARSVRTYERAPKCEKGRLGVRDILCLAADQFIAKRQTSGVPGGKHRTTILAGFPWFADWGRDAFVSLPGLLLSTGRFDEAKSVLITFATAVDEGMIPNRFDDYSNTAYFNSIDASLWFIHAAFQYLYGSGDSEAFTQELLPTIRWVIDSFHNGTRFGIRADSDGLITGGNNETQLTWMDAKYDGVAFTGRYGKAVEINALWYNCLCYLAQFYAGRDTKTAEHYESMSERVAESFPELFWNDEAGYLNDCILPDGSVDTSLRPNQIFAVSLPFSALSARQQRSVVDVVQKYLLTPYGLRTLSAEDSRYKGIYTGGQRERDEAYHQGTVWPYLMGPFVEAYLKVNNFSRKSKKKSAEFIQPLLEHLTEDACLGQISEIFDSDAPHRPRGCIAQAWSVAEVIRAYRLINS